MADNRRDRWTEEQVLALPSGEHDYFERKSGQLFDDMGMLLGKLAKAVSALANSGGGHIVLGVADDGSVDGVPPRVGRTLTREWLEQKMPYLVNYPLSGFRVHTVERSASSTISDNREVVVIDVPDSPLAPHQCIHGGGDARKNTYYFRQGGRSEPAPHFYLELLRQRLVNPVLEVTEVELTLVRAGQIEGAIFVDCDIRFLISNVGRVAAYKWAIHLLSVSGGADGRENDYRFRLTDYPPGFRTRDGGIRLDDTILPGGAITDEKLLGLIIRAGEVSEANVREQLAVMLGSLSLQYQVATETSPGAFQSIDLGSSTDLDSLASAVLAQIGHVQS